MSADEIRKTGCPGRVCFTKDGTVVTRTPPSDSSAFLRLLLWEYVHGYGDLTYYHRLHAHVPQGLWPHVQNLFIKIDVG